jgi:TRAP-type mannitol/chloroaromatic compound transport system permease small subunit
MPSLTFILPHWLYWSGLVIFPLVAIYFVRRERRRGPGTGINLPLAYLFWLMAGFLGMHRFYLRNPWGLLFIPVFGFILWTNDAIRAVREDVSRTRQQHEVALRAFNRAEARVQSNRPGSPEALSRARDDEQRTRTTYESAQADMSRWQRLSVAGASTMAILLLIDAALLPGLVRRARRREGERPAEVPPLPDAPMAGTAEATSAHVRTPVTDVLDRISTAAGVYVAYWSVIAVFFYYYEVLGRYVFNSPTNWVHESMFLMFGMQYLYSGAYAYRDDAHVRVDVFYVKLSPRGRAVLDIITSVFFFIFAVTLFWTGLRFALDSINLNEHSFTEWGVHYWPIKLSIPIGALLLILQGLSKLIKDIVFVARGAPPTIAAAPAGTHFGA